MQTMKKIYRSEVYQNIFPDELMLSAFKTTTPSQQQKNEYFFNCWMDWKNNECKGSLAVISNASFKSITKRFCESMGLKEFWDYQIKGLQVRFKEPTMKAFYLVAVQGQIKLC